MDTGKKPPLPNEAGGSGWHGINDVLDTSFDQYVETHGHAPVIQLGAVSSTPEAAPVDAALITADPVILASITAVGNPDGPEILQPDSPSLIVDSTAESEHLVSDEGDIGGSGSDSADHLESDPFLSDTTLGIAIPPAVKSSVSNCVCNCITDFDSVINFLMNLEESEIQNSSISCHIQTIIRCCNFMLSSGYKINDYRRLAFCDAFFRIRHEYLFKLLCKTLNFVQTKTDVPFSDFGIDSNRTPDLIIKKNDTLYIIEVSASSSFEKAAISKGLEEAGFESKYSLELAQLTDMGIPHFYHPVLFDMSNPTNVEYKNQILALGKTFRLNKECEAMLEFVKKEFCFITNAIKSYNSPMAAMLFSKSFLLEKDHSDLTFMYQQNPELAGSYQKYQEFTIAPKVYLKVANHWHRLESLIRRATNSVTDDAKIKLYIDSVTNSFKCVPNIKGYKPADYINVLASNNKLQLIKMLGISAGGDIHSASDSTTGVKFVETVDALEVSPPSLLPEEGSHTPLIPVIIKPVDYRKHKERIYQHFSQLYFGVNYNPSYENNMLQAIKTFDSHINNCRVENEYIVPQEAPFTTMLCNQKINSCVIETEMSKLQSTYLECNSFTVQVPVKIPKSKCPFLLPLGRFYSNSYGSLHYKNISLIQGLMSQLGTENMYTYHILENVMLSEFSLIENAKEGSQKYKDLCKERSGISIKLSKVQSLFIRHCKQNNLLGCKISKSTEPPELISDYKNLVDKIKKLSTKIKSLSEKEGLKNASHLIRLPTKGKKQKTTAADGSAATVRKGDLYIKYQTEMKHYRDKKIQSSISGVGIRKSIQGDYEEDFKIFMDLMMRLPINCGENPNLFMDYTVSKDAKLLSQLKQCAVDEYKDLITSCCNSSLGHACSFVSRIAHTLLYLSQMPFSSDYIKVDNLGYKNVLLLVKGGKKIFKTKSSKMFRLIYPIDPCLKGWYCTPGLNPSSYRWLVINGCDYVFTPWIQLHESILNDAISFYPRIMSFCVLNLKPNIELKYQFNNVYFNVLLSFHNRRKTEVLLANLRYILLSTLGDYTGIIEIFSEFLGFNYDCFQSLIRSSILLNYPDYFNSIKIIKDSNRAKRSTLNFSDLVRVGLNHIFTKLPVSNEDNLALMIYSTFLMTKAPYQRPVERSMNLKSILNTHEYFDVTVGASATLQEMFSTTTVTLGNEEYKTYVEKLFSNDFNYDPEYCSQIGVFADSYFVNRSLSEDLHTKWLSVLEECWDEMSTSTGLRGRIDDKENFWGQKGYFVVYKELVQNREYMDKLEEVVTTNSNMDIKRKMLREINIQYKNRVESKQDYLVFHAVDKTQWRGSREIYVMDIETKTLQQPIEKYMGYLCSQVDSELISISSDRRAQVIHHAIFEKDLPSKDALTWYLTLDCRKWAPRSNFLKFVDMILCMNCLPPSFKTHFLNYINKLYKKRVYFNNAEVEVLKNNPQLSSLVEKYLVKDDNLNGYYLSMPYSWVMGIFNYVSSFMHAFNQKYSSYIIFKSSMDNYGEETSLVMFAHSDDSGGRITSEHKSLIERGLCLYEIDLKKCNHLISLKKSSVSRFYFEILSIIYLFGHLLALLPKFLGGLRFLPSDKGPANDMLQCYSKCIEVLTAGGSFNVAYLVMKFYSFMVHRFYYVNRNITELDFRIPVQYLGLPDAHPLMVLLCGSDAEICRIMFTEDKLYLAKLESFIRALYSTIDDDGPIKCIKFRIKVRGLKKDFENVLSKFEKQLQSWSLGNVNFHNTGFNILSFLKKLSDPGFVGSLVNESTTRRISRAYYIRSGDSCVTNCGLAKLVDVKNSIWNFLSYTDSNTPVKDIYKEIFGEEACNTIDKQVTDGVELANKNLSVYSHLLSMPIKTLRYLDKISMDGKQFVSSKKTLKPTYLELPKTSKVFSVKFDPAQMVSFMKENDYYFALPNVKNLFTGKIEVESLLKELGYNLDDIYPETLLKLIRTYSNKHMKSVYLYSQVPSELRHIKNYTSLLTFLAVNSKKDCEIQGLVMHISDLVGDPSLMPICLGEELYFLNNIVSITNLLLDLLPGEVFEVIKYNQIDALTFPGGDIGELLESCKVSLNADRSYMFIAIQLGYLEMRLKNEQKKQSADVLKHGAFYTFLKSQKSKSGWYGTGSLAICCSGDYYIFHLSNRSIISVECNRVGKVDSLTLKFIYDVLMQNGVEIRPQDMVHYTNTKSEYLFAMDNTGGMSFLKNKEADHGYPALKTNNLQFLDNLSVYTIEKVSHNLFILETDPSLDMVRRKVYTLSIMKGSMADTMYKIINKESLLDYFTIEGIDSFDDYVMTELLPIYGSKTCIGFDEFIDNFSASRTYKIFCDVESMGLSKVPRSLNKSILPAPLGSLIRILVDYSNGTDDKVIKTPKELTPAIMSLRGEYPEETTIILAENLSKYHTCIYTDIEREEINDDYCKLYVDPDNPTAAREGYINLMRYWGYGSLVNTLETYSLSKNNSNYKYFNLTNSKGVSTGLFMEIFINFNSIIEDCFLEHIGLYNKLDCPTRRLINPKGLINMLKNHRKYLCLTCNFYNMHMRNIDLNCMYFFNALLGYLKEEEFLISLKKRLSQDRILCIIPVSYQERFNIIATYNVLKSSWFNMRKKLYKLNWYKRVERLPVDVRGLNELNKELNKNNMVTFPPSETHYHGFLNDRLRHYFNSTVNFETDENFYVIKMELTNSSELEVNMLNFLPFIRPLHPEFLSSENWEEISYELECGDPDVDNCEEQYESYEGEHYTPTEVSVQGNRVRACIKVIAAPYQEGLEQFRCRFRQCGENIVVLTTVWDYSWTKHVPNSHSRILDFGQPNDNHTPEMIALVGSNEAITMEAWDYLLGGTVVTLGEEVSSSVCSDLIRNGAGDVTTIKGVGIKYDDDVATGKKKIKVKDGITTLVEKEEDNGETAADVKIVEETIIEQMEKRLKEAFENGHISKRTMWALRDKYILRKQEMGLLSMDDMLKSCLQELELNELKSGIVAGVLEGLTSQDIVKIFQAPEFFGLARNVNREKRNPVKDKKLAAELDSLYPEMSKKIGSGSLMISEEMYDVAVVSLKHWKNTLRCTKKKTDNKRFLMNFFIAIVNTANIVQMDAKDDYIFQKVINKISKYLVDNEDDEDDDDETLVFRPTHTISARLKYTMAGATDMPDRQ